MVRRDGSVYWTDSAGGLVIPGMVGEDMQRHLDIQGVFRLTPQGEVELVVEDTVYPNGLCFSPDENILYVNDTRLGLIRAFDVNADGSVRNGRVFHKLTGSEPGVADGMKCDREGNVYCTGPGGIHVHGPGRTSARPPARSRPQHQSRLGRRRLALALRHDLSLRLSHPSQYSRRPV